MQPTNQGSLFPLPSTPAPAPVSATAPLPRQVETAEALLRELTNDWWSILDPRNWREPGPTDAEILARYHAIGTPEYDIWPIVSGSRMYSYVWPSLRQICQVPDERLLAACHTCRSRHLSDAHDTIYRSVLDYTLTADLIDRQVWNGDSWANYLAFTRFTGRPAVSLTSLAITALTYALHRATAAYHTALAARFRPALEPHRSSRSRTAAADHTPESEIAQIRQTLVRLHTARCSPQPLRSLLAQATIGPRFEDPAWPHLATGDPLPPGLMDNLAGT